MRDWHAIQRQRTEQLERKGYILLASEIGQDEMVSRVRRKEFPAGTVWFWRLQEAWGLYTTTRQEA